MSEFEIITITLSFIVGLGVAQLLNSSAIAVRKRNDVTLHWLPFTWTLVILLFSVQYWFALFYFDHVIQGWNWLWYGLFLILAIVIFVAGALILPPQGTRSPDSLLTDFNTNGRFALLALAVYLLIWIAPNTRALGTLLNAPNFLNIFLATVSVVIFRTGNYFTQSIGSILYLLLVCIAMITGVYAPPGFSSYPL